MRITTPGRNEWKLHTAAGLRPRLVTLLALGVVLGSAGAAHAQPGFSKSFAPSTIGPGSTTTLIFTIANNSGTPVSDLAFGDTLPSGVTIADPPSASTTCGGSPTLTAPAGGTTISFSDGTVGAGSSCTVRVNVTAVATGNSDTTYTNVSGDLTSSAGNSGTASADLNVDIDRPGFLKLFSPSTIPVGGRSTLTFTIDNELNPAAETFLDFTDTLPAGMVIADPANASTTCGTASEPPTLTANPGSSVIDFFFSSFAAPGVAANSSCFVFVDVTTTAAGTLDNVSSDLQTASGETAGSGRASDSLVSTATELGLRKSFLFDPVPPGSGVTLQFRIDNRNRDFTATGVGFTDDLDFTPSMGITAGTLPADPCGAGSTLTLAAGDVLTLSGGTVAPGGSCTFTVPLTVPVTETPGAYVNTTSAITGTIDGVGVTGNAAADTLFVETIPIFVKEFTDDPVGGGGSVTLTFTIANTDPSSSLTDIAFQDDLETALLGLAANSLVAANGLDPEPLVDPCGSGSELTIFDSNDFGFPSPPFPNVPPVPTQLIFTGGSLTAAGTMGSSCSFSVVLDVPVAPGGIYTNTTGNLTADQGATPIVRGPASDGLEILGAPRLTKDFTDDPVEPGDLVTLEFTLRHSVGSPGDATGIGFTDDLTTTGIAGLKAAAGELPKSNLCGPGNGSLTGSAGDTLLTFSGGPLAPGDVCTFSLLVEVPAGAPGGIFTNTTSPVGATVDSLATTSRAASADLVVAQIVFSKEFTDDPVLPGGSVTLEFTLINLGPSAATGIEFTDDLGSVIAGLLPATGELPQADPCGSGSALVAFDPPGPPPPDPSILHLIGGSLAAAGTVGDTCTFSVILDVPGGTPDGTNPNLTSSLDATIGGTPTTLPPAFDSLTVDSDLLFLTKEFTDDPVAAGGTVNLRFTIDNLDLNNAATGIGFTDDLDAELAGLKALGLSVAGCGGTLSGSAGDTFLTFAGGSLPAGGDCFFDVTVEVPAAATPGQYLNATSSITGTIGGLPVTGGGAGDLLRVGLADLTKTIVSPVAAGGSTTITFNIKNLDSANPVSDLAFSDNLDSMVPGAVATGLPKADVCGTGSALTGTSLVNFSGGNLGPGAQCSFDVTVSIPPTTPGGSYVNVSSPLTVSGLEVSDPATASLTVQVNFDFGDAPDPTFPTLLASDGARHVRPSALFLGAAVDIDADGQPTALADGDDTDAGGDDEDGVVFTTGIVAGASASVDVTASAPGLLNAWVDFNGDGDWGDAGEQIFLDQSLAAGVNSLGFAVPSNAAAGATYARFRVNTSGGLSFTGLAADGEVEDYRVTIARQVDLAVTLSDDYDPAVAGKVQLYAIAVTNSGPSDATGVTVAHTLPTGFFLGGEPTSFPCTLAGSTATCTIGPLPAGATETLTVGVLLDARSDVLAQSTATVSSTEADTNAANNSDTEDTALARARSIVPTFRGSTPILVTVAKEAEETVGLVGLEAAGGGNRQYSVAGAGLKPVDMAVVPDFTGTPSPELAVLGFGFDGSVRVLVYDVDALKLLGSQTLAPAAPGAGGPRRIGPPARAATYPVPGTWVPIDIEVVPSFAGGPAPELALLLNDLSDGSVHVVVMDAGDGAIVKDITAISGPDKFGLGMEVLFDFDGSSVPEVGLTARNRANGDIENVSVNLDAGATPSSVTLISFGLFPLDVAAADLGGTPGPDLAFLTRRPSDGALAVQVLDLDTPTLLPEVGFDDSLKPVDLETVPDFGGAPAPELAVLGRLGSSVVTEIRDGSTGAVLNTPSTSSPPKVPVPLGLAVHPNFGGGPASEISVLFEYFGEPTQVEVWDAAGTAPLFVFSLP